MNRVHLHLDNFLSEEAEGSQYVLTSPTSLEACRQLGIKPLELLPQSLEEYDQQLSGTPLAEIYQKFDEDESKRVEKLATVRALWQKIKQQKSEAKLWESSRPQSSKRDRKKKKKMATSNETRRFKSQENLRRRGSPTEDLQKQGSSTEDMRKHESSTEDMRKQESSTEDMRKHESYTEGISKHKNTTEDIKNYSQTEDHANYDDNSTDSSITLPHKQPTPYRPKSAGTRVKSYSVQNLPTYPLNIDPLSIAFRGCGSAVDIRGSIPPHDQRILELMAMRRLLERQMEEQAEKYRMAWEIQYKRQQQEHELAAAQHRAHVMSRRAKENAENTKRLVELERQFLAGQKSLWHSIMIKQQRAQQLLRDIQQARREQIFQRQKEEDLKKRTQEEELRRKEESESKYSKMLVDISDQKMKLALEKKKKIEDEYKRKLMEANLEDDQKREMILRQLALESENTLRQMKLAMEERERKVKENYQRLQLQRNQSIKQRQMSYDSRRVAAARIRAELDTGMAQLRDEVRKLQLLSQQKAQEKVEKSKQRKREELRQARENKERQHQMLLMSVQLEESATEKAMREQIAQKLARADRILQEKEKSIQEARRVANTTAQMRQQIKSRLSPETFDRKALRADLEIRLSSRPLTPAPTPVQRSHIILG